MERTELAESLKADRARMLTAFPVSREILARLDVYVDQLLTWQGKTNLVGDSTIPNLWTRHIADSLQLLDVAPEDKVWVDLGSGAGLPGLVLACALADVPGAMVHLVESNRKKSAFLRQVAAMLGLPARVHAQRIEEFTRTYSGPVEAITARAVTSVTGLLTYAHPLLKKGAKGVFPKGQHVDVELTEASRCWNMEIEMIPSRTGGGGVILVVRRAQPLPTRDR
jgi:16S rRNA (guanine527-N7)-methyltransferase